MKDTLRVKSVVKGELDSFFRRVPLPWNQKQRTYKTTKKRIQDGKTRYMLRGVVSHFCCESWREE